MKSIVNVCEGDSDTNWADCRKASQISSEMGLLPSSGNLNRKLLRIDFRYEAFGLRHQEVR